MSSVTARGSHVNIRWFAANATARSPCWWRAARRAAA